MGMGFVEVWLMQLLVVEDIQAVECWCLGISRLFWSRFWSRWVWVSWRFG
ncbi:unnamed protein product [Meloidogyne enterolobii]|uniref:Uncharacterized protein n=1 Tax=Meloidogyne enterolobii TaxID=390850 RepID=A0ACB1B188_MELEN